MTGLAKSYTNGLEQWQAEKIILNDGANNNLARSLLDGADYQKLENDKTAKIGYSTATFEQDDSTEQDVALFGIDADDFYQPKIVEGKNFANKNQVVVGSDLKKIGETSSQRNRFYFASVESGAVFNRARPVAFS